MRKYILYLCIWIIMKRKEFKLTTIFFTDLINSNNSYILIGDLNDRVWELQNFEYSYFEGAGVTDLPEFRKINVWMQEALDF